MISIPRPNSLTAAKFQALASLLQKSGTGFESSISGKSMEPAISHGARIRIHRLESGDYKEGQIVACIIDDSLFAHRIVYCGRGVRAGAYILTQGDGWLLCDPPTPRSEILGIVTEVNERGVWRTPVDHASRNPWKRIVAGASFRLVRLSLVVHLELARTVAGVCLILGAVCKKLVNASKVRRLRA